MFKFPPILRAAEEGDLERLRQLIEGGVSLDICDSAGWTPLHFSALRGRYEVVDFLTSGECNLNSTDRKGCTPLLLAADSWREHVVVLLLQRGAQITCADDDGWTVLHHASRHGWTSIVRSILDRGEADINAPLFCGDTPLMLAAEQGHSEVAALLIRAGADVLLIEQHDMTALHSAAWFGHTGVVQLLLEDERLELNPQDVVGNTPLHKACSEGHREVVKQLLEAGADTTLKNNKGETALNEGIRRDKVSLEEIRLFVQHSAFLQDCDYKQISEDPLLKENVLKDVDICTQSIVNKYHHQSLPALKGKFNGRLPSIDKFKLLPKHICDVENFVKWDIQANKFCNVIQARPIVLRIMCVESLLDACQSAMKRSAVSDFDKGNSPFKKPRIN